MSLVLYLVFERQFFRGPFISRALFHRILDSIWTKSSRNPEGWMILLIQHALHRDFLSQRVYNLDNDLTQLPDIERDNESTSLRPTA